MMSEKLAALKSWLSVEHRLIGTALLRIGLGCVVLCLYAQHLIQFPFLWGSNGVIPFDEFHHIIARTRGHSIFELTPAHPLPVVILGLLITIAFTVGFHTRIMSVLFYVFTFSLYARNPFLLDGGDNLLYLVAFYLILTDCGARFSFDAAKRKSEPNAFVALLHNVGVAAIVTQLVLLYFTSSFYKIQGHMWQDGTAIYYILRSAEFNVSSAAHYLWDNDLFLTFCTWSTIFIQLAWVFWIWHPRLRWLLVSLAIGMHMMIAWFMGLFWFSAVMICAELIVLSDREYITFAAHARKLLTRFRAEPVSLPLAHEA